MSEVKHSVSSDGFVAVDVDELAQQLVVNSNNSSSGSPRLGPAVKKILTRKGSQAGGSGGVGGGEQQQHQGPGERSPLSVHVAAEEAATPDGGRWNNRVGTRRSASPWLNPNRVVIVFAALSSMGTLILLYFTLSMVKLEQ
ncbi:uncharacterized protein LOC122007092 [Zingiber officinale]|uniref:uncharacterized protein LOC122007092 n=1 Tax=Zingiber officinale TaxID=94328 RepID=UPI001C4BC968|nr:uncharacterized protein LOC122007092 [Zingiber officinale]